MTVRNTIDATGLPISVADIHTILPIDRETNSLFVFTVGGTAERFGVPRGATTTVRVTIGDVNDNAPRFTSGQSTSATVSEAAIVGAPVFQVFATDADAIELYGRVTYSLPFGGSNKFRISDASIGAVSVADSLDRETQASYTVVVRASDGGGPGNVSFADFSVTVSLSDVNDCAPVFDNVGTCGAQGNLTAVVYQCAILEAQGSECFGDALVVGRVSDSDDPNAITSTLSYSLFGGSGHGIRFFTIDSSTGRISLASPIDAVVTPSLDLLVLVADGGTPPLTALAEVQVAPPPIPFDPVPSNSQHAHRAGKRYMWWILRNCNANNAGHCDSNQPRASSIHIEQHYGARRECACQCWSTGNIWTCDGQGSRWTRCKHHV